MRPVIYQIFTRLYGNKTKNNKPNGTLQENGSAKMNDITATKLQRISRMGFTHVWFTGLIEHATQTDHTAFGISKDHPAVVKGKAGSPYAIKDYYDIDPDLAVSVPDRMKEFKALLNRTHKAGLKMVIDFVPNHVARHYHSDAAPKGVEDLGEKDDTTKGFDPQNNFYYLPGQQLRTDFARSAAQAEPYVELPAKATGNDCFNASPSRNDWYETVKLNYGIDYQGGRTTHFSPTPSTWKKMTDILLFWAEKGVDAFRCDMAEMVPTAFWSHAVAAVKKEHPDVLFIGEVYNPAQYRDYLAAGFDYLYDKVGLYDTLRAIVCGNASASCITSCWQATDDIKEHMLHFLENHDEQRIASAYFAGNAEKAKPALAAGALMSPGAYMVYAGQEIGEAGMDAEGFSGNDGRTTIFDYWNPASLQKLTAPAFEKKLTPEEAALYDYYQKILTLCNSRKAFEQGGFFDLQYANYGRDYGYNCDRQYSFLRHFGREVYLVAVNFDPASVQVGIKIPSHAFDVLKLREGTKSAVSVMTEETVTVELRPDAPLYVQLPAYGVTVLRL
ncbi:alpha-amylase family glycosyl hydrolase [Prevotellamassilia timonensis]|uniref:alpha-amylase family glycosyl hydrolase n=1 Tax=Prevotellamassilia timonensis TaxID=1852370 RepID=UPI001F2C03CC|nr:alpha-amylase family glycosyl hydrolase [Prevotellamassilia timonensis]MCF2634685.1 alpha-amylase [Prevotellamassilia timonensis]